MCGACRVQFSSIDTLVGAVGWLVGFGRVVSFWKVWVMRDVCGVLGCNVSAVLFLFEGLE